MIVVRVELWPYGDERAARHLGTATIYNNGTGTHEHGNYNVEIGKWGTPKLDAARRPATWRRGQLYNFPRQELGPWDLLMCALVACLGARSKGRGIRREGDGRTNAHVEDDDKQLRWQTAGGAR